MLKKIFYNGNLNFILNNLNSRKDNINKKVTESVEKILDDIKRRGDKAVIEYVEKFDRFCIKDMKDIIVSQEEIEEGAKAVGENFIRILERTKYQITEFHKNQIEKSWSMYKEKENGKVPDVILAAAKVCGIEKIYKIGGAQAIGAVAYGTETISKVDKIVGPGNIYVATAKKLVFGTVDIDMIAGPSEVLVIADENSNPKYIAGDLMSQAEHDRLSSSILITTSEKIAEKVNKEIFRQIENIPRKDIIKYSMENFGATIIVNSIDEAFDVANEIAPEHLEILTENPMSQLPKVYNAGSIFIGENSPEPLGDYMSGTNHVLPTSGTAKFYSPLGVYDFVKYSSYTYYPRNVLEKFKDDVMEFAKLEGLEAHANSIKIRFEEDR